MDRLSTKGQMIDQIDLKAVPHSAFDRSNHNYGTGRLGSIMPTRLDEVYPGDRIKGRPEVVVNFEPLAAPIMGSMVVKQESFFVPYIQLWRHAYKFFTGKNGFNEPMPAVSPREIWIVYNSYVHSKIWSGTGSAESPTFLDVLSSLSSFRSGLSTANQQYSSFAITNSLYEDFVTAYASVEQSLHAVYDSRKMFDLVQPVIGILKRFVHSDYIRNLSVQFEDNNVTASTKEQLVFEMSGPLGNLIEQVFNYFHGPSSLFDYLGWPLPLVTDNAFEIPQYGIKSIFQYGVYRNLFIWGSYDLSAKIGELFSEVALVFNPFKAYYLIWYWNYRDQLLETGILDPEEDEFLGTAITENVILYCTLMRQRCWFKDTYTTALTNTGSGNLLVPTGGQNDEEFQVAYLDATGTLINTTDKDAAVKAGAQTCIINNTNISYKIPMNYMFGVMKDEFGYSDETRNYISLDLFDRIKRLRSVVQKRLILGYEVDDVIWSSFMVKLSNVRMHIPEILGRGRDSVQINTVVNNTSTDQQIAGDKTATAWAHGQQSQMDYFSEEWGLYMSFMTIMPIQSYAGGMQRLYIKRDALDYMWPEYATMGMDAIYNCELAAIGSRLTDTQGLQVFGYQGRYYDLKSRQDEEHGRLLTDLNYLTFSREWDKNNPPKLNYIFVHCWPRLDGFVLDDPTQDVFRYDCYNAQGWERRLPVPSEIV